MDRREFLKWGVGAGATLLCHPHFLWEALAWEQRDEIYRRRAPYLWAFYKRHPERSGIAKQCGRPGAGSVPSGLTPTVLRRHVGRGAWRLGAAKRTAE